MQGSWSLLYTGGAHSAHQLFGKGKDDSTVWYFSTPPNSEHPAPIMADNSEYTLLLCKNSMC